MIVYERRGTHANVNVVKINRDNWMVRDKMSYYRKSVHHFNLKK